MHDAVLNMLQEAAGLAPGGRVLIVSETPGLGYFDDALAPAVAEAAGALGYAVERIVVAFRPEATEPSARLLAAMEGAEVSVFLARIADQTRFRAQAGRQRRLICYAIDRTMFDSGFASLPHGAMLALRDGADAALAEAGEIRITCPAGTDLRGRIHGAGPAPGDTHDIRFPLTVTTPVPAGGFSGRIVQKGFLTGTGSHFYRPYACEIADRLDITVTGGRITGLDGAEADVARAREHYAFVADRFGIDPWIVHSWHTGLHPACAFPDPASASFERWSGAAFGNPRILHFHTCGDYAPGEICLNLLDPTVTLDGVALTEAGVLRADAFPRVAAPVTEHAALARALADPARACGEASGGGLSFR